MPSKCNSWGVVDVAGEFTLIHVLPAKELWEDAKFEMAAGTC